MHMGTIKPDSDADHLFQEFVRQKDRGISRAIRPCFKLSCYGGSCCHQTY